MRTNLGAVKASPTGLNKVTVMIGGGGGSAGVQSFNNRTGHVTLNAVDVVDALSFTPADKEDLADVATTGSFRDLVDVPQLVNTFNNRFGNVTLADKDVTDALGYLPVNGANLDEVAYSGDFNDLKNTPTPYALPAATPTTLGGIKVGANLTVLADGTLNATGGGGGNYQPTLANVITGQSSLAGTTAYVRGDLNTQATVQLYQGFHNTNGSEPNALRMGRIQTDANGVITQQYDFRVSNNGLNPFGLFSNNGTTDLARVSVRQSTTTILATDGPNTTQLITSPTGVTLSLPANATVGSTTVLNKGTADKYYVPMVSAYSNATIVSTASQPFQFKMSTLDGTRSQTIGCLDGTRGGYWLNRSIGTASYYPWMMLSVANVAQPVLQISNNYAPDAANGPYYGTGLNIYLDRIERFQNVGTPNWTPDSLITQAYADSRYWPGITATLPHNGTTPNIWGISNLTMSGLLNVAGSNYGYLNLDRNQNQGRLLGSKTADANGTVTSDFYVSRTGSGVTQELGTYANKYDATNGAIQGQSAVVCRPQTWTDIASNKSPGWFIAQTTDVSTGDLIRTQMAFIHNRNSISSLRLNVGRQTAGVVSDAFLALNMTTASTSLTLTAPSDKPIAWTADSLITQAYADTRYQPIARTRDGEQPFTGDVTVGDRTLKIRDGVIVGVE